MPELTDAGILLLAFCSILGVLGAMALVIMVVGPPVLWLLELVLRLVWFPFWWIFTRPADPNENALNTHTR